MLDKLISKLEEVNNSSFATSLITQYKQRGTLSDKQWYWVEKLVKETTEACRYPEIYKLLQTASSSLKYPKLRLEHITIGWYAKKQTVIVNDKNKNILAAISSDGSIKWRNYDTITETTLNNLEHDPAYAAKLHGQQYGHCCFCGLELTNSISISYGYGPICAEKWGLPWEPPAIIEISMEDL